jgi:HAD superfamily hydrolase (TIGR01549 family)
MKNSLKQILNDSSTIFFDFDGVIKDSVDIKTSAFKELFSIYDQNIVDLIEDHHQENGGLSRFDKIPLYLSWAGESVIKENIDKYCQKFSMLVMQSVIDSPWVPGVRQFIKSNYDKKNFIIVTATPKDEIDEILKKLDISDFFIAVYGSPVSKDDALISALIDFNIDQSKAIMIGDSYIDYAAAKKNNLFFALRRTNLNHTLQSNLLCFMFNDFNDE